MLGKKKKNKAADKIHVGSIIIEETLSNAKVKEYNELLTRVQQQLKEREMALEQLRENISKRKDEIPLKAKKMSQYEEQRKQEKENKAQLLEQKQGELQTNIKKYQSKCKLHKIVACVMLVGIVIGSVVYYNRVCIPAKDAVENMNIAYDAAYQEMTQEHEADLEAALKTLQEQWNSDIVALEAEKVMLEEEIVERLQTAY